MKPFVASFDVVIMRYYLMMAVVVIAFFIGVPALSFLALPIFLLAFMGVSFKSKKSENRLSVSLNESKNENTPRLNAAA